jgi:hypothetical protein
MSFVYLKQPGHVLSVVTIVAALTGKFTAADLASPFLAVRDVLDDTLPHRKTVPDVSFYITPDNLDVFVGAVIDNALKDPRNFWLNPQSGQIEPFVSPPGVTVLADHTVGVTVTVAPAPVAGVSIPVLVVSPGSGPAPAMSDTTPGKIVGPASSVIVSPVQLVANTYVLVLVAGCPPVISKVA